MPLQRAVPAGQLTPSNVEMLDCTRLGAGFGQVPERTLGLHFHASIPLYFQDAPLGIINVNRTRRGGSLTQTSYASFRRSRIRWASRSSEPVWQRRARGWPAPRSERASPARFTTHWLKA